MKNIKFFYLKIFIFLMVKFSLYLNRRVFVMDIAKMRPNMVPLINEFIALLRHYARDQKRVIKW